jgi:hypothetical protein
LEEGISRRVRSAWDVVIYGMVAIVARSYIGDGET